VDFWRHVSTYRKRMNIFLIKFYPTTLNKFLNNDKKS